MEQITYIGHSQVRDARQQLLSRLSASAVQERAVQTVCGTARRWLDSRMSPNSGDTDYPGAMVWESLEPLLVSLNPANCWALIDREDMRGLSGATVIGHVIAGNTPLLGITSIIRALLVGSASIVKLPSQGKSGWLTVFLDLLATVDAELRQLISSSTWSRSNEMHGKAFYEECDLIVAYGSDTTIDSIRRATNKPVLSYGHRVSAAMVIGSAVPDTVYDGIAKDLLLYDQSGCLSPHTLFVEGSLSEAAQAANRLAIAVGRNTLPSPLETPKRAAKVAEYRSLLQMDTESISMLTVGTRATVVAHKATTLHVSPTHGVIYVVGGTKEGIIEVIRQSNALIQGVSLGTDTLEHRREFTPKLKSAGVSYVCLPGELQKPGIEWREDNRDLLRSLS